MSLDWVQNRVDTISLSAVHDQTIGKASVQNKQPSPERSVDSKLGKATASKTPGFSLAATRSPTESAELRRMLNESKVLGSISRSVRQNTLTRDPISHMPLLPRATGKLRMNGQRLPSLRRKGRNQNNTDDLTEIGSDFTAEEHTELDSDQGQDSGHSHSAETNPLKTNNDATNKPKRAKTQQEPRDFFIPTLTSENSATDSSTADIENKNSAQILNQEPSAKQANTQVQVAIAKLEDDENISEAQLQALSSLMSGEMPKEKKATVVRKPSSDNLFSTSESYEDSSKRSRKANVRLLDTVVYGSFFGNVMAMTNAGMSFGSILPGVMVLVTSLVTAFFKNFGSDTLESASISLGWMSTLFTFWN